MMTDEQLKLVALTLVDAAQEIVATQHPDGMLTTLTVVYLKEDGRPDLNVLPMEFENTSDKQSKIWLAGVASGITLPPIEAVYLCSEAWVVQIPKTEAETAGGVKAFMDGKTPAEHPKRKEIFMISCLTKDQRSAMLGFDIQRDADERIVALVQHQEEWQLVDTSVAQNTLLDHFFDGERKGRFA